jgi:hypothetical protein
MLYYEYVRAKPDEYYIPLIIGIKKPFMRKVILYMQISIDGVVSDPERWMTLSDDIIEDTIEYYKTLDTIVLGSHSFPSAGRILAESRKARTFNG